MEDFLFSGLTAEDDRAAVAGSSRGAGNSSSTLTALSESIRGPDWAELARSLGVHRV